MADNYFARDANHFAQIPQPTPRPTPDENIYGVPVRAPYQSELAYFRNNPHVGGMAAEDNSIIINPFSTLSDAEKNAVKMNEAARIYMRSRGMQQPAFNLTPEQSNAFASYGPIEAQRQTITGRLISGDPSALTATPEQSAYAKFLKDMMLNQPKSGSAAGKR